MVLLVYSKQKYPVRQLFKKNTMKHHFYLLLLLLAVSSVFSSCDDDDSNFSQDGVDAYVYDPQNPDSIAVFTDWLDVIPQSYQSNISNCIVFRAENEPTERCYQLTSLEILNRTNHTIDVNVPYGVASYGLQLFNVDAPTHRKIVIWTDAHHTQEGIQHSLNLHFVSAGSTFPLNGILGLIYSDAKPFDGLGQFHETLETPNGTFANVYEYDARNAVYDRLLFSEEIGVVGMEDEQGNMWWFERME